MEKKKKIQIGILIASMLAILLSFLISAAPWVKHLSYSEFLRYVDNYAVESVTIKDDELQVKLKNDKTKYKTLYFADEDFVRNLSAADIQVDKETDSNTPSWNMIIYILAGMTLTSIVVSIITCNGKGSDSPPSSESKNKSRILIKKDTHTTFADIGGLKDAKDKLKEVIKFIENPDIYTSIGAKLPKGVLLVGPPGTGKTMLAKAVAGEAKVPFLSVSGSDFVEMYVGLGAARIRKLFEVAKKNAPCIVFIDEIDTIGKQRDSMGGSGADEREQTLNQLLSEMDGLDLLKGVLIIAATNRPEVLDSAIIRPGRFDRIIRIPNPDLAGRLEILNNGLSHIKTDDSISVDSIAFETAGCSGAELINIINEAAIRAVSENHQVVTKDDMVFAIESINTGGENIILNDMEKAIISVHEAAHALASIAYDSNNHIQKISIIPKNNNTLGYTLNYKRTENHIYLKGELLNHIRILLSGYCAEKIFFEEISSAASDDIYEATSVIKQMITCWGMSDEFGPFYINEYLSMGSGIEANPMMCFVDKKAMNILKECIQDMNHFINENAILVKKIAETLSCVETLYENDLLELLKNERIIAPDFKPIPEINVLDSSIPSSNSIKTEIIKELAGQIKPNETPSPSKRAPKATNAEYMESKNTQTTKEPSEKKANNKKAVSEEKKVSIQDKKEPVPVEVQDIVTEIEMDIPDIEEPDISEIDLPIEDIDVDISQGTVGSPEVEEPIPNATELIIKKSQETKTSKKLPNTNPTKDKYAEESKKAIENILNLGNKSSKTKKYDKKNTPKLESIDDDPTEDDY